MPSAGFFYFAPTIGSLIGAILGHWLHDMAGASYRRRHGGKFEPEARLIITWLATLILAASIIILGFAVQRTWHYMIIAVFTAGQVCGIMIATTALNAYLLDSYPGASGEVAAWLVVGRTMGGFMAVYIEIKWVTASGPEKVFGIQGAITVAASVIIAILQVYGKRIRLAQGKMDFLS